jgi:hypothetical protein
MILHISAQKGENVIFDVDQPQTTTGKQIATMTRPNSI